MELACNRRLRERARPMQKLLEKASRLRAFLARLDQQSDEWLDAHLLAKLLIGLFLCALIIGGIIWAMVTHTRPVDTGVIAYLLIGGTCAYTLWAVCITLMHLGYFPDGDEEEEDGDDEEETDEEAYHRIGRVNPFADLTPDEEEEDY